VLAFAILLLIPYAIVKLLASRLGAASRESALGPIDRVLGFGFGSVKGVLIAVIAFSVLVLGYDTVWGANGRPDWISQSRSYPFIDAASREMVEILAERRQEALDADAREQAARNSGKKQKQP
jgi:membrane protein required for colicin V production